MNLAATEADILQSYALRLDDPVVRELVARWHEATRALHAYVQAHTHEALGLGDVSTLAEMCVDAENVTSFVVRG